MQEQIKEGQLWFKLQNFELRTCYNNSFNFLNHDISKKHRSVTNISSEKRIDRTCWNHRNDGEVESYIPSKPYCQRGEPWMHGMHVKNLPNTFNV